MNLCERNLFPCDYYSFNGIRRIFVHCMYVLLVSHLPRNMEGEVTYQLPEDTSGFGGKVSHKRVYRGRIISTSCYILRVTFTLVSANHFSLHWWFSSTFASFQFFNRLISPKHVHSGKFYFVIQVLTDIYSLTRLKSMFYFYKMFSSKGFKVVECAP